MKRNLPLPQHISASRLQRSYKNPISIFPSVEIGIHYHANVGAGPDHTKCHCGTLKSFCQVRCLPCAGDGSGFACIKDALKSFFLKMYKIMYLCETFTL